MMKGPLLLLLMLGAGVAFAQEATDLPFVTRSAPGFGDATASLREFLRERHVRGSKAQHFCVVGYQTGEDRRAWIHWKEGGQMILWEGSVDPLGAKDAIARSRRALSLRKDVVETSSDLHGSTYLVTRAWVDHVLSDCTARGEKYVIQSATK